MRPSEEIKAVGTEPSWLGCDDAGEQGWVRQFSFLFWTWTISSANRHRFIEIRLRRILGYEEVSYYSRTLWLLMNGILFCIFGVCCVVGWIATLSAGPEFYDFLWFLFGPLTLVFVVLLSVFYYLTFVPPKQYRATISPRYDKRL